MFHLGSVAISARSLRSFASMILLGPLYSGTHGVQIRLRILYRSPQCFWNILWHMFPMLPTQGHSSATSIWRCSHARFHSQTIPLAQGRVTTLSSSSPVHIIYWQTSQTLPNSCGAGSPAGLRKPGFLTLWRYNLEQNALTVLHYDRDVQYCG
jgi:hypothetical protein